MRLIALFLKRMGQKREKMRINRKKYLARFYLLIINEEEFIKINENVLQFTRKVSDSEQLNRADL